MYVTVIIDLTPVRDKTGPARLLDMVEGRSKQAFKTWLGARPQAWREGIEVVARACQVVCVSGLVLDGLGESFGVAEGELVEGLCPALDGGALD